MVDWVMRSNWAWMWHWIRHVGPRSWGRRWIERSVRRSERTMTCMSVMTVHRLGMGCCSRRRMWQVVFMSMLIA